MEPIRTPKIAQQLVARIVDDIAAEGWPVGKLLGSEAEMTERYAVSRETFRAAVRILEYLDVAHTREGRGGGLVTSEPQPRAVAQAAAIRLRYVGVTVDELYEARTELEVGLVEDAIARLDDEGVALLRDVLAKEADHPERDVWAHTTALHTTIAQLSGSRPYALFLDMLISLSDEYSRPELDHPSPGLPEQLRETQRAHAAIVQAIIDGDVQRAIRRMRTHLTAVHKWMPRPGDALPETFRARTRGRAD